MELTFEMPDDVFATFRRQKIETVCAPSSSSRTSEDRDIIDSSELMFSDDENWLCGCSGKPVTDLQKFLYDTDPRASPKNIDTRTFTRPKKRFTRPSIEKYNEELYGADVKELTDSGIHLNGCSQDATPTRPLHFELGQTTTSVYFDNILANAPTMDSFQNMSPPSLVNSMCSSTFTTLMESSFIKNDPVLREIRDTDFTGSILQQEAEPMFQSITESYSSLNSDVPENFLKKVAFSDGTGTGGVKDATMMNATFAKGDDDDLSFDQTLTLDNHQHEYFQDAKATTNEDLNSTYQRRAPGTIRLQDPPLGSTFQRRRSNKPDLNSTMTIEREKNTSIENVKRLLDRRPSPSPDLNRLSYLVDKNDQLNATFTNESPKRNSFGSTDSGENLDYMSLSSGSSKSSRMHSTDGINVMVDGGEHNSRLVNLAFARKSILGQISSTPKPANRTPNLWSNHEISPIRDRNSDPELSSNEQIQPVIQQGPIRKQKSVGHLNKRTPNPKSMNTLGHMEAKGAIRSSHPNLRMAEQRSLQKPTNLNAMGHTLKGSYTSLRPMNAVLPVAPPPLDATVTKAPVAQVPPLSREVPLKSQDAQFVKPQPPKSGLPRPVTGIPRPASRIPGPRNIRAVPKSAGQQGRY